uniref:Uncharacterized protein n=1 Tax=viral metagenome TaxID=1070528 RepID=A0A6M3IU21_9ZZZZ
MVNTDAAGTDTTLLRAQLEAEITQQALVLFKDLRREYSDMNERLQTRVAELEKQRAEHTQQIDDLASSLKTALRKEKEYQATIRRLTREVEDLIKDLASLRNENVELSREVAELRQEVDGFRSVMRD